MSATAVKERPILFSGEMVKAILDGRKTMTRRIVKAPIDFLGAGGKDGDEWNDPAYWGWETEDGEFARLSRDPADKISFPIPCPYGERGERLWVRETFAQVEGPAYGDGQSDATWVYLADWAITEGPRWRPSIHMPRAASRITLEIESVRVERLQEISDSDIAAEGFVTDETSHVVDTDDGSTNPRYVFMDLWEKLNGPGSWDANPFVWAISFKRLPPCAP